MALEGGSYAVQPSEGEPLPFIGQLKVSAARSGGSFKLFEYEGPAVPPLHVHRDREEVFFILEGHFTSLSETRRSSADPGTTVLVPAGHSARLPSRPRSEGAVRGRAGRSGRLLPGSGGRAGGRPAIGRDPGRAGRSATTPVRSSGSGP